MRKTISSRKIEETPPLGFRQKFGVQRPRPAHNLALLIYRNKSHLQIRPDDEKFGRKVQTVAAGHVDVQKSDVDGSLRRQSNRFFWRSSPRPIPNSVVLMTAMRASLLSSTTRTV